MKKKLLLLILGIAIMFNGAAQNVPVKNDTQEHIEKRYTLYYRVNKSDIDKNYKGNGETIATMLRDIQTTLDVKGTIPRNIKIIASASPEGSATLNKWLALERANKSKKFILDLFPQFNPNDIIVESCTNDWSGVIQALKIDKGIRYRDTILSILTNPRIKNKDAAVRAMPEAFEIIREGLLDNMRTAAITITVLRTTENIDVYVVDEPEPKVEPVPVPVQQPKPEPKPEPQPEPVPVVIPEPTPLPPFYMAVKTNMLYDLIAIPNVGIEFYLGKEWSILGNWMYSWWKTDRSHWYWRTYGGDITLRKWFGKKAQEKPLTGHHIGIYGQIVTYDFETGGRGYLADKWSGGGGIEYGYALPVGKRLNIDFNLGMGFSGGNVKEYIPIDSHYVWQKTKKSQWFGPTKVEVSLSWLLGRGNINKGKGGKR